MLILYLYVDEKKIYFLPELSDFVIDVKYGRFFYYCHKSLDLPGRLCSPLLSQLESYSLMT